MIISEPIILGDYEIIPFYNILNRIGIDNKKQIFFKRFLEDLEKEISIDILRAIFSIPSSGVYYNFTRSLIDRVMKAMKLSVGYYKRPLKDAISIIGTYLPQLLNMYIDANEEVIDILLEISSSIKSDEIGFTELLKKLIILLSSRVVKKECLKKIPLISVCRDVGKIEIRSADLTVNLNLLSITVPLTEHFDNLCLGMYRAEFEKPMWLPEKKVSHFISFLQEFIVAKFIEKTCNVCAYPSCLVKKRGTRIEKELDVIIVREDKIVAFIEIRKGIPLRRKRSTIIADISETKVKANHLGIKSIFLTNEFVDVYKKYEDGLEQPVIGSPLRQKLICETIKRVINS